MRTGAAAVAFAKATRSFHPSGRCQQFTRTCFGVGAYYGTAALAWKNASKKHSASDYSRIPAGVPVFWTGGRKGYGHAAVSLGNGLVRSTDWPGRYQVNTARISDINRAWGMTFAGWTEDINRQTVYYPPVSQPKIKMTIDASDIERATRKGTRVTGGLYLKQAVAKEVGAGEMHMGHTKLGSKFQVQYALVQRKYLTGAKETKANADGVPGPSSLRWLGERHGFNIK